MKRVPWLVPLFSVATWASVAGAAPASSVTQYGITWTFDKAYETGQFATGDHWVVGPVVIQSVSPTPTATRNGSCVNPMGGRQGYDSRGGEFKTDDQVTFPHTLRPDESMVSSVSKPEGAAIQNAGNMVSQAVLTAVTEVPAKGTLRPAFAGTYKHYFNVSQILWSALPKVPAPPSAPSGTELIRESDRPRADHLSSWTIQNSCAQENWDNGPGAHACYGREVSAFVSSAALYVMLDTPQREEVATNMVQIGIDNYGILKAGGNWAPNGGHHSGRKWPIVLAASLLNDCDMLAVGKDYDDSHFGEDGQTYFGKTGTALFGWDCQGGQGAYFENACSGSGAKDCRDPAGAVDGCLDYRNCCTSGYWVGQMLSALMLGAKSTWNHDAYFAYVDRWMAGDVEDADGTDAFGKAMWTLYRNDLPGPAALPACGSTGFVDGGGSGGVSGAGGASGGATASASGGTSATGTGGAAAAGKAGSGGVTSGSVRDAGASSPAGGAGAAGTGKDEGGCGCHVGRWVTGASSAPGGRRPSTAALWYLAFGLCIARARRRR